MYYYRYKQSVTCRAIVIVCGKSTFSFRPSFRIDVSTDDQIYFVYNLKS